MLYNPFYNIENPDLMRYEYVWVNYVKEGLQVDDIISKEILESWQRCLELELDYLLRELPKWNSSSGEFQRKLRDNEVLLNTAIPVVASVIDVMDDVELSVQIVEQDGYCLKNIVKSEVVSEINHYFSAGMNLREENIGTNSVDMAIRHKKPFKVEGAEHYCQVLHKVSVYAAPIFDVNGNVQAVISMTVKLESTSKYILGMIVSAAKVIEDELQLKAIHAQIVKQNIEQDYILNTVTDAVVCMDENNMITVVNNEMIRLTGLSRKSLTGKNVSMIKTNPPIAIAMQNWDSEKKNAQQIQILGQYKVSSCFLDYNIVEDTASGTVSKILVFVKTEEIQALADKISSENRAYFTFEHIIGNSTGIRKAVDLAKKASAFNTRVLIEGESGTGKEVLAQAIHNGSDRKSHPFVAVDCGAIPRELIESELFGYEEGAYTGARKGGHRGKFQIANGGTLFLDEISNMPMEMQAKLLRVLQENRITKIGGYEPIPIDVKIVAAANKDLEKEVAEGTFRGDLLYRLNIVHIKIPPLRDRREDIPLLVQNFIDNSRSLLDTKSIKVSSKVIEILKKQDWPGNVRQLNNVLERMIILSGKGGEIDLTVVPKEFLEVEEVTMVRQEDKHILTLEEATAQYIAKVLEEHNGNIKKTAEALDISRATVYRILKKAELL